MTQPAPRQCKAHEFHFYPDYAQERGWRCCFCSEKPGEPPGYSPQLDRERIEAKVYGILDTVHQADLIYISNSCHGDAIVSGVAERCREEGRYDQGSILAFIVGDQDKHAEYWKKIGDSIIAGKDIRERCPCGKLANTYSGGLAACGFECLEKQRPSPPATKRRSPRATNTKKGA